MHLPVGKYEGKEINCTRTDGASLTARELTIKEELFDIIGTRIIDGEVLDINDPNGLYGIESLSRGAGKVIFLTADEKAQKVIESNLKSVGAEKEAEQKPLMVEEYFVGLEPKDRFNVIFFTVERQEEVGAEARMVRHLNEHGLLIMFVPINAGFQVPVSVEGAVIQETRDCEDKIVLVVAKNQS